MEETRDIPAEELSALRDPATRRGAFDRLVGAYLRPLYWHARRLVVVHEDAEDVVQETFIRAYDKIGTFRGVLHAASQCGEPEQQEDLQFLFGALHLKPEERAELLGLIDGYLRTHSVPEGGVEHWEYVLMAYRADEE